MCLKFEVQRTWLIRIPCLEETPTVGHENDTKSTNSTKKNIFVFFFFGINKKLDYLTWPRGSALLGDTI